MELPNYCMNASNMYMEISRLTVVELNVRIEAQKAAVVQWRLGVTIYMAKCFYIDMKSVAGDVYKYLHRNCWEFLSNYQFSSG